MTILLLLLLLLFLSPLLTVSSTTSLSIGGDSLKNFATKKRNTNNNNNNIINDTRQTAKCLLNYSFSILPLHLATLCPYVALAAKADDVDIMPSESCVVVLMMVLVTDVAVASVPLFRWC